MNFSRKRMRGKRTSSSNKAFLKFFLKEISLKKKNEKGSPVFLHINVIWFKLLSLDITRFHNAAQVFAIRYTCRKLLAESSCNKFHCAQIARRPLSFHALSHQISSASEWAFNCKAQRRIFRCSRTIFNTSKSVEFPREREMRFLTCFCKRARARSLFHSYNISLSRYFYYICLE